MVVVFGKYFWKEVMVCLNCVYYVYFKILILFFICYIGKVFYFKEIKVVDKNIDIIDFIYFFNKSCCFICF